MVNFFERKDRCRNINGEGVGIYLKNNIKYLLFSSDKEIKPIWIRIFLFLSIESTLDVFFNPHERYCNYFFE